MGSKHSQLMKFGQIMPYFKKKFQKYLQKLRLEKLFTKNLAQP